LWICAADPDKIDEDMYGIAMKLDILPEMINPAEKKPLTRERVLN
jgi:hypothetical protein